MPRLIGCRSRVVVTGVFAVVLATVVTGCGSEAGPDYQAQLSSVQAQESSAAANEKFAADAMLADQHINAVQGPERVAEFTAITQNSCPGSVLANRLAKLKAENKIDGLTYAPGKRTEIIGAHTEADPNHVLVVLRNRAPAQQQQPQAIVMRVKLGTNAGKKCVSEVERV